MSLSIPRVRMFAGPNGSGKTTIKLGLDKPASWLGFYINPDDIELAIKSTGRVQHIAEVIPMDVEEIRQHLLQSGLSSQYEHTSAAEKVYIESDDLVFPDRNVDSYLVSALADYLRRQALKAKISFSFETVMSHPDKVEVLRNAQENGYRTYLYFVATDDPDINVARVENRVLDGGHEVPERKIRERYFRSLEILPKAIAYTNRGYFFDTSTQDPLFFAESTDGKTLKLFTNQVPNWFSITLNSFTGSIL